MRFTFCLFLLFVAILCQAGLGAARWEGGSASTVSQYGITWTFDKAHPVGQFVNGAKGGPEGPEDLF